jgi:hypothetical protein
MNGMRRVSIALIPALVALFAYVIRAQSGQSWETALTTASNLTLHGAQASVVTHLGHPALRLIEEPRYDGYSYAVVTGPVLQDGRIEADVAGRPAQGAPDGARGFVGLAFRVRNDHSAFECFYLRPTNGRADDQLRRNHSTQYISHPDFPWERLRGETPGVYESYVDMVAGEWTHIRVEFHGRRGELYVNRAPQPVLIVNDLKLTPATGGVALWIGANTEAFFRDLRVSAATSGD